MPKNTTTAVASRVIRNDAAFKLELPVEVLRADRGWGGPLSTTDVWANWCFKLCSQTSGSPLLDIRAVTRGLEDVFGHEFATFLVANR